MHGNVLSKHMAKTKKTTKIDKADKTNKSRKAKWVYTFGDGKAEGRADMRDLLGGKGAGLAEMANLGLPVPPGFTITTEASPHSYANNKSYPRELADAVAAGLPHIARVTGRTFGDPTEPL